MRGLEWNSIGVSVIEVTKRKNEMGMDGYERIENIDANGNEKTEISGDDGDGVEIGVKGVWNNE